MIQQGNPWPQANIGQVNTIQPRVESAPANPVPGAVQSLGDQINELDSLLDSLRGRLHLVLHPSEPRPTQGDDKCKSLMSPLVDEVFAWRLRVQLLNDRVRDMLDRLET